MQTVTSSAATATTAAGIVVQTALTAGGLEINHSESVVRARTR